MEKINYHKKLDELIDNIGKENRKPDLLLHSCCGPCSSYCLTYLRPHFNITVLYFNPNIYPEEEYRHRLHVQRELIDAINSESGREGMIALLDIPYDHSSFTEYVAGLEDEPEGGARCEKCFRMRLDKTFETAVDKGFEFFGTTLTVSPHKNAVLINRIGDEIALSKECGCTWLPSDFKKKGGYLQSIQLSKKYNLYRQDYCGCEFSIWH